MRKTNARVTTAFVAELQAADNPRQVGKVLRQVAAADLPHRVLVEAGAPEVIGDYSFDISMGRYRRMQPKVGERAVAASLADRAVDAFAAIKRSYSPKIDKQHGPWRPMQGRHVEAGRVTAAINKTPSAAERAACVRDALAVSAAALADVKPKGSWTALTQATPGSRGAIDVLAAPYPRHPEPHRQALSAPTWNAHPASAAAAVLLIYRRAPLLDVVHGPSPVQRISSKGACEARGLARRNMKVYEDTFFAVQPEVVDLVNDADFMEDMYQARGEGMSDIVVPAAGFLVVEQEVCIRVAP